MNHPKSMFQLSGVHYIRVLMRIRNPETPANGSFRKLGGTVFGVLIIRILGEKGTRLGSPIFGNSQIVLLIIPVSDGVFKLLMGC